MSGARVFSAGSLEFGWALDGYRVNGDGIETPVDPRVQQFVRNMIADLTRTTVAGADADNETCVFPSCPFKVST